MSCIDRARLEEISMGDAEFTIEIIDMALEDFSDRIRSMQSASEEENWEQVGREAHAIKGTALNIGANGLAPLAAGIDDSVRKFKMRIEQGAIDAVQTAFKLVEQELGEIRTELAKSRIK